MKYELMGQRYEFAVFWYEFRAKWYELSVFWYEFQPNWYESALRDAILIDSFADGSFTHPENLGCPGSVSTRGLQDCGQLRLLGFILLAQSQFDHASKVSPRSEDQPLHGRLQLAHITRPRSH